MSQGTDLGLGKVWKLQRDAADSVSTVGTLWDHGGMPLCRTLERAVDYPSHPAIPTGEYELKLKTPGTSHFDPSFRALLGADFLGMVEITSVPHRTNILLHTGNYWVNSLGCVLLGVSARHDATGWVLGESRMATRLVYPVLSRLIRDSGVRLLVDGPPAATAPLVA